MRGDTFRKVIGVFVLLLVISLGFSNEVREWAHIPTSMTVFEGELTPIVEATESLKAVTVSTNQPAQAFQASGVSENDVEQVSLEVAGIPVKSIDVTTLPKKEVIPGGQSIGVKLNTEGVLVVGHHLVETDDGSASPGETAGIEVGDMITEIDGHEIQRMSQVGEYVQAAGDEGRTLNMVIKREHQTFEKELTPIKAKGEHSYRMGLYIRDSAAGVGTLTFYDPETKKYGALGHVISDVDTQKPIVVHDGQIIRSSVTSIEKGSNGDPGEKLASLSDKREILGSIEKNSSFGIFGTLKEANLKNNIHDKKMPVALSTHVKEGPAKILTVVEGEDVEEYDIEIVSSVPQKQPATKGMVIKVTDPKLLEATGGIVQGMSGSPIIQDGKIIGAVTHVFVNDPTSGYGCHISWMLEEAGVTDHFSNKQEAKAS
ncbi:SpoIVB peptidase [Halalkalibacter akibai]|uniref:Stage IV sporulation protein B n=1 Tax=Halalkalibacter akibai (strain ATCC 43226 / DSM 21942 / CIP 109018 / JCM 9157 / 1139) TaxID=1236973 RepID=W4QZ86_HALA3|nr:SpoIVB peptidase [Halalkalibacter akibai]GAE36624.1 stage IV sporulation protein B [Halalkalibacter akibai JCM 9157]